eukprot:TRINITY_DN22360_c0_g1_i1.p1 TRINITY_DN22360_c0_g1~~TRINITY_DN22360_c0_g1_i1.p1  ORF type:complete len:655 (+),score=149.40 TRINITY_DN22360_c0_g1_i1:73-2037(+)
MSWQMFKSSKPTARTKQALSYIQATKPELFANRDDASRGSGGAAGGDALHKPPTSGFESCGKEGWLYNPEKNIFFEQATRRLCWFDAASDEYRNLHHGRSLALSVVASAATKLGGSIVAKQPVPKHVVIPDLHRAAQVLKMDLDHLDRPAAMLGVYGSDDGTECVPVDLAARLLHEKLLRRLAAFRGDWRGDALREVIPGAFHDVVGSCGGAQVVAAVVLLVGRRVAVARTSGISLCFMAGVDAESMTVVPPQFDCMRVGAGDGAAGVPTHSCLGRNEQEGELDQEPEQDAKVEMETQRKIEKGKEKEIEEKRKERDKGGEDEKGKGHESGDRLLEHIKEKEEDHENGEELEKDKESDALADEKSEEKGCGDGDDEGRTQRSFSAVCGIASAVAGTVPASPSPGVDVPASNDEGVIGAAVSWHVRRDRQDEAVRLAAGVGANMWFQELPDHDPSAAFLVTLAVGGARWDDPDTRAIVVPQLCMGRPKAACITLLKEAMHGGATPPLAAACARLGGTRGAMSTDERPAKRLRLADEAPSKVRVRQILLRHWKGEGTKPVDPVHKKPISRTLEEAELQMLAVLEGLLNDKCASFSSACKKLSECQTALKGGELAGDLGWLSPTQTKGGEKMVKVSEDARCVKQPVRCRRVPTESRG